MDDNRKITEDQLDEILVLRDVLGDHEGAVELAYSILKVVEGSDDPDIESMQSDIKSFIFWAEDLGYGE